MSDPTPPLATNPRPSWWRRWATIVLALVTVEVLVASGLAGYLLRGGHSTNASITVSSTGSVKAKPDTATFQVSVNTNAATASGALTSNNHVVAAVIAALEAHHVLAKDLQTSSVSVTPNTVWPSQRVVNYTATNSINVTMNDLPAVGGALTAAVDAGGNSTQIYGVSFEVTHRAALQRRARYLAGVHARDKAEQIAAGTGASVGQVESISETDNVGYRIYYPVGFAASTLAAHAKVLTTKLPIEPGNETISSSITVRFSLNS